MKAELDDTQVTRLLREARRIAVLGIKPETQSHKPACFVPRYLVDAGYEVVPVPVYYPDVTEILGQRVYRKVAEIPGPVDIVDVFRRPEHILPHVPDLIAARPRAVWFQSGIRNDKAAELLSEAGILVIQDRCLMTEHERLVRA